MMIDQSDDHMNARESIRLNCEFDSNEIDENETQNRKYADAMITISRGTRID
jgi:hypothetical protein